MGDAVDRDRILEGVRALKQDPDGSEMIWSGDVEAIIRYAPAVRGKRADRGRTGGGEVGMNVMRIKMTICFPMLDGETKNQALDRLIERIDPDGDAIMSWHEYDIKVCADEEIEMEARV